MNVKICRGKSNRDFKLWVFKNTTLQGHNLYYPNVILDTDNTFVMPVYEKTMSLSKETVDIDLDFEMTTYVNSFVEEPVFFFIYNTDNYFHFLYDSLPTLHQYFELRKIYPTIKLLMKPMHNYPYIFDCLQLLGITEEDIIIAESATIYSIIYVSNSLTHDGQSNDPPPPAIWSIYQRMKENAMKIPIQTPSKFYVSRRSWIHGDTSNIGTNYTTRRKLMCEDELVVKLKERGYEEVFCEKLTMTEKIQYFANATHIIGAIGGGMCNCVFSRELCNVISINSPDFDRINHRFLYTMNHTNLNQYKYTWNTSNLYRRVRYGDVIGEIVNVKEVILTINVGENITGWSLQDTYNQMIVHTEDVTFLDNGLNSPWTFDINKLFLTHVRDVIQCN
jgi:hypothetical protein